MVNFSPPPNGLVYDLDLTLVLCVKNLLEHTPLIFTCRKVSVSFPIILHPILLPGGRHSLDIIQAT